MGEVPGRGAARPFTGSGWWSWWCSCPPSMPRGTGPGSSAGRVRDRREYVLPARFDGTPLPWLLSDMATVDLDGRSPQQFAAVVARNLAAFAITPSALSTDAEDSAWDTETARRESKIGGARWTGPRLRSPCHAGPGQANRLTAGLHPFRERAWRSGRGRFGIKVFISPGRLW